MEVLLAWHFDSGITIPRSALPCSVFMKRSEKTAPNLHQCREQNMDIWVSAMQSEFLVQNPAYHLLATFLKAFKMEKLQALSGSIPSLFITVSKRTNTVAQCWKWAGQE